MLAIYEKLFLLALDEEKGNFYPFTRPMINYGLVGAMLAELALQCRVCSDAKHRLQPIQPAPTGDMFLDEILLELGSSDKIRRISYWIDHFSGRPKKLRTRIGEQLAARNLLVQEDNRFYWPHAGEQETVVEGPSRFAIKENLRAAVFTDAEAEVSDMALLNVISGCGLLGLVFTQDELPVANRLIHEKIIHLALKNPDLQTVEEIEYAIVASIDENTD